MDETSNYGYIYTQDIVHMKINKKTGIGTEVAGLSESDKTGIGTEVAGLSESDKTGIVIAVLGDSELDSDETDQVKVLWMGKPETTETVNDVVVVDRSFLTGDFVVSASDPTGQLGLVVDVNLSFDLSQDGTTILRDVSSRRVRRVRDFTVGDYVVLDSWVGVIKAVSDRVTVLLDDGKTQTEDAPPLRVKPARNRVLLHGHFPYYPGMCVDLISFLSLEPSSDPPDSRVIVKGTVTKVAARSVSIIWFASALDDPIPGGEQSPQNIKLLPWFGHANWQLGDRCLLTSHHSSSTTVLDKNLTKLKLEDSEKDETESTQAGDHSDSERVISDEENFERALRIINIKTKVDVAWQDGAIEKGLDSITLIPSLTPLENEFVAEQYVIRNVTDEGDNPDEVKRAGVVKSVNAKERTARVRWIKPVERAGDPRQFEKEEVVSVFELQQHPHYVYRYGDIVVRRTRAQGGSDLSCFGNIIGLRDGEIEVTWADGITRMVGPQVICVAAPDISDLASGEVDNAADTLFGGQLNNTFGEWLNSSDISSMYSTSGDEISSQNSSQKTNSSDEPCSEDPSADEIYPQNSSQKTDSSDEPCSEDPNGIVKSSDVFPNKNEEQNRELGDSLKATEALCRKNSEEPHTCQCENGKYEFKGFDITRDPSDHHFHHLLKDADRQADSIMLRKVQKDWKILEDNLPGGIYVRVYEDRMDLITAVIVGAHGTPYQDGLYVFDFHLPHDYPNAPPVAYYRSGGLQINPNLYKNGNICLSLLNTWEGEGSEAWLPSSTILQLLVSLQALVLNPKPYFNEDGYDKQVNTTDGEQKSSFYNENTFLLNCQTMMNLMRNPPKDFKDLIKEHFSKRGYYILRACACYMKGCLIGTLTEDASPNDEDTSPDHSSISNSVGFKLFLAKIVPSLFADLSKIGADCEEFRYLLEVQPGSSGSASKNLSITL